MQLTPIVSDPNDKNAASHTGQDAWEFYTGKTAPTEESWRFKKWVNAVTLRSIELYSEYEPGYYIDRIAPTPLLMLIAEHDAIAATDLAFEAFN